MNDSVKKITLTIIGTIITVASYLVYYLIYPHNYLLLSFVFLVDYAYLFCSIFFLFFSGYTEKRIFKSIIVSIGFIAVINLSGIAFSIVSPAYTLGEVWFGFLAYSFFLGPSVGVIAGLIMLLLIVYGYAYEHQI